jgi:hypothetical protein
MDAASSFAQPPALDLWTRHNMALDDVAERRGRVTAAFTAAGVEYALIGGQAVALWWPRKTLRPFQGQMVEGLGLRV